MDAVTAVFGGGLRVGVVLHGKKIRDDNITLLQTGISCDDKVENLGFTLEPATVHPPLSQSSEDPRCLLPCDSSQPVTRYGQTHQVSNGYRFVDGFVQIYTNIN